MHEIKKFLNEIGILFIEETITEETIVPGILIRNGALIVDPEKLLYPGDLLHEAGHIAVTPVEERTAVGGDMGKGKDYSAAMGEEIMAICWSYAAAIRLGLPPEFVFHPNGYKGASDWYIEQFTSGSYIGLPGLQWLGLCYDQKNAAAQGVPPYPHMIKWLRGKAVL